MVTRAAVSLGTKGYGVGLLTIHGLAALAAYRRLWAHMPVFDYADLGSMVGASAVGGSQRGAEPLARWTGDAQDQILRRTRVSLKLTQDAGQPRLSLQ